MALPLLPEKMILGQYLRLRNICYAQEGKIGFYLQQFSDYFKSTWISGNWKVTDWCQFRKLNRTNNVSEGSNSVLKKKVILWRYEFLFCGWKIVS